MLETDLLLRMAAAANEAGDSERARTLYEQGASLGDSWCWHALGYMHDAGKGVVADKAAAMSCYKKAVQLGNPASANNIAILYRERGNRKAVFSWFKRAAKLGDEDAHLQLAKCYRDGIGVRRSLPKMLQCLSRALQNEYASDEERAEVESMLQEHRPRIIP